MIGDFVYGGDSTELATSKCLNDIAGILSRQGSSLNTFGLPQPQVIVIEPESYSMEIEKEMGSEMFDKLNDDQRYAFDAIMEAVEGRSKSNLFFVDGPGGSGKTYLYSCLMHNLRGRNLKATPAAFTGIAATLLEGGRTLHSRFGIPVPCQEYSVSRIKPNTKAATHRYFSFHN